MDLSMAGIGASLAVGIVGLAVFRYGKKASRAPQFVAGVALMGSPYFASSPTATLVAGGLILASLWLALRFGL